MLKLEFTPTKENTAVLKTGYTVDYKREDKTKSQRLVSPKKIAVVKAAASSLTESLPVVCPITGLVTATNFPIKDGFFLEAYHPIVHNCKAMIKDTEYYKLLDREQKAGLILAALDFYKVLSLESSSLVVNLAMQANLTELQLDTFIVFIQDSLACTSKSYPLLSLDSMVKDSTLLGYMTKCYEVEHTNYETVSLDTVDDLTKKLFTVPKFLASDKRGSAMDKEAHDLYLDVVEFLPNSLVDKAKPFVKTLITNTSSTLITRLISAIEAKATTMDDSEEPAMLLAISELKTFVEKNRETASKLGIYSALDLDAPAIVSETEIETAPVIEVEAAKPMGAFAARMAAMKAKGVI